MPICLFHKVICLQEVLVFVDKFFFNKELTLEKDFDEGFTLNDIHNEMAHVAAVKYALVKNYTINLNRHS